ncbi:YezD family protein [Alteribacillus iranensis]|uniref:DUF2292 domain-containing protein n=1 Tax=Alteribacillus iranensis TaxID=930128 RepID=A0A1I1ZXF0_9BACI|nr:YezD family protein [Alteribacillus iranensis]SFE36269.1 hypothetical protein SAMN05192532_101505 [Alteribacillus iranensis]
MKHSEELDDVFAKLKHLLKDLKFGSVILVVQDGKVVQLEKKEKMRL